MNKTYIIGILLLIVVGAGTFFGGMKYQQSKQPVFTRTLGAQDQRVNGNRAGFQPVAGKIIVSDDKSITVQLQDGSSKIVLLSDKTVINKAEQATTADLKTGETVRVIGQTNSDGSVTASDIQLNPMQPSGPTPTPGG